MRKYYKIDMQLKNSQNDMEDACSLGGNFIIDEKNSIEQIVVDIAAEEGRTVDAFEVSFHEYSLQDFIDEELSLMKSRIKKAFFQRLYGYLGKLTVIEYGQLMKNFDEEHYYEALLEENRLHRLDKVLRKRTNPANITLAEYECALFEMIKANTNEELNAVINNLDKKC